MVGTAEKHMKIQITAPIFDYKTLRFVMGLIAIAIAPVVSLIADITLSSVSASYHTEARNVFVGMLFIVGGFLGAYNGHTIWQSVWSKVAAIAALVVALFPTECDTCLPDRTSFAHGIAALTLFVILAYFCFGPFRKKTKGQGGKKSRRSKIYLSCGLIMVGAMVAGVIAKFAYSNEVLKANAVVYWVEAVALTTFGFAWFVAGKTLNVFVDEDQKHYLLKRNDGESSREESDSVNSKIVDEGESED